MDYSNGKPMAQGAVIGASSGNGGFGGKITIDMTFEQLAATWKLSRKKENKDENVITGDKICEADSAG